MTEPTTQDVEPRTEAGRRLSEYLNAKDVRTLDVQAAILDIENEAGSAATEGVESRETCRDCERLGVPCGEHTAFRGPMGSAAALRDPS